MPNPESDYQSQRALRGSRSDRKFLGGSHKKPAAPPDGDGLTPAIDNTSEVRLLASWDKEAIKAEPNGGKIRLKMILLRKGLQATILGLRLLFCAPKGLQNSAQDFNPGNCPARATRPEGGARSNVLTRRKRGPMVQLSHVPIAYSDFCAAIRCEFHLVPASLALSGRRFL